MQIKVKTLTGKEIEIDIEPNDKITRIKERVEEKEGIPPAQQSQSPTLPPTPPPATRHHIHIPTYTASKEIRAKLRAARIWSRDFGHLIVYVVNHHKKARRVFDILQEYSKFSPYGRSDECLIKRVGIHIVEGAGGSVDVLSVALSEDVVILIQISETLNNAHQIPSAIRRYLMNPNLAKVGINISETFQKLEQYNLKDDSPDRRQPLDHSTLEISNILNPISISYKSIVTACFPTASSIPQTDWSLPIDKIPSSAIKHAAELAVLPLSVFRNYVRPPPVRVLEDVKFEPLEEWRGFGEDYWRGVECLMKLLPEHERIRVPKFEKEEVEVEGKGVEVNGENVQDGSDMETKARAKDWAGPEEFAKPREFLSNTFKSLSAQMLKTGGTISTDEITTTLSRQSWPLRKPSHKDEKTWLDVIDLYIHLGWLEESSGLLRLVPGHDLTTATHQPLPRRFLRGAERAYMVHEETLKRHREAGLLPELFNSLRSHFTSEEATRHEISVYCWRWANPGFLWTPDEDELLAVQVLMDLWIREGWIVELESDDRILIETDVDTTGVDEKKRKRTTGDVRAADLLGKRRKEAREESGMTRLGRVFEDEVRLADILTRNGVKSETPLMEVLEVLPVGGSMGVEEVKDMVRKRFVLKNDAKDIWDWYLERGLLVVERKRVRVAGMGELKSPLKEL
ncbi:hypothetical protein HK097_011554, partial [Rhizophlyctis rosea]